MTDTYTSEELADALACCAVLRHAPNQRDGHAKQAMPTLSEMAQQFVSPQSPGMEIARNALVGAGIGGVGGMLGLGRRGKRRPLSDALRMGLLGAALGGGGTAAYRGAEQWSGRNFYDEIQKWLNRKSHEEEKPKNPPSLWHVATSSGKALANGLGLTGEGDSAVVNAGSVPGGAVGAVAGYGAGAKLHGALQNRADRWNFMRDLRELKPGAINEQVGEMLVQRPVPGKPAVPGRWVSSPDGSRGRWIDGTPAVPPSMKPTKFDLGAAVAANTATSPSQLMLDIPEIGQAQMRQLRTVAKTAPSNWKVPGGRTARWGGAAVGGLGTGILGDWIYRATRGY